MESLILSSCLKKKGFSPEKVDRFFDAINHGYAILSADKDFNDVKEIALWAVGRNGYDLWYVSDNLRADKDVVLMAVSHSGLALQFASEDLRNNKEIVLTTVKSNGHSLRFASDSLRGNKEIVLAAIKSVGAALQYANDELRDDEGFLLSSISDDDLIFDIFKYVSDRLKNNPEFVLDVLLSAPDRETVAATFQFVSEELWDMVGGQEPIACLRGILEERELNKKLATVSLNKRAIKI